MISAPGEPDLSLSLPRAKRMAQGDRHSLQMLRFRWHYQGVMGCASGCSIEGGIAMSRLIDLSQEIYQGSLMTQYFIFATISGMVASILSRNGRSPLAGKTVALIPIILTANRCSSYVGVYVGSPK